MIDLGDIELITNIGLYKTCRPAVFLKLIDALHAFAEASVCVYRGNIAEW